MGLALIAGLAFIGLCLVALSVWWLADKAAGAEFEAMDKAWLATGRDTVSALRRDLYKRAGLTPMMSAPQPDQNLPGL